MPITSYVVPLDPKTVQIIGLTETKTSALYVGGQRQEGQFKSDASTGKLIYRGTGIVQVNGVATEATIETLTEVHANSVPFGAILTGSGSRGELRIRTAQNGFGLAVSVFVEGIAAPAAR